jgi:SAM-dependent methyltransferase
MSAPPRDGPLNANDPVQVRRAREALDRAGYGERRILDLLGEPEWPVYRRRRQALPLFLHRTRGGSPLDTLVRLFLLHQAVSLEEAARAVAPQRPEDWQALGLLRLDSGGARGAVELSAYRTIVAIADWPEAAAECDPVMPVAASSRALAQLTIRRPVGRTLDLGTGGGVLAFLAAAHSGAVVGTDTNPRAVHFASFNALFNGKDNVTCVAGNLFEPVAGLTFDLIACNPPFILAVGEGPTHTHSGLPADELCRTIVRQAPAFLNEGGFAQVLCNWPHVAGEDWKGRLAGWFAGTGCDAWALQFHVQEAAEYAAERIAEAEDDPGRAADRFREWLAEYGRQGIEAVGFGLVTLRKAAGRPGRVRCEEAPPVRGECGDVIERGFRLGDFLEAHRDDQALLRAKVTVAPGLRWEQEQEVAADGWKVVGSRVRVAGGLGYAGNADRDVAEFLAKCRGTRQLGELLNEAARSRGQKPERLAPAFLGVVRRMVELGCLLPAEEK